MNKHQQSVRNRFSKGTKYYNANAIIQKKVASKLARLIKDEWIPSTILEAGCGSGILTSHLAQQFPKSKIIAFDLSSEMISFAQQELRKYSNIRWLVGDTACFQAHEKHSLIVSSSSLHWVSPLATGIKNLFDCLLPGGDFLFSIMVKGTLGELREARSRVIPKEKQVSDLLSTKNVLSVVKDCGFIIQESFEEEYTLTYKSVKMFLVDIHRQGLTGGEYSAKGRSLSQNEIHQLIKDYQKNYSHKKGNVFSTYNVLFVRAQRE